MLALILIWVAFRKFCSLHQQNRRDVNIFVGCDARLRAEQYYFQHLF